MSGEEQPRVKPVDWNELAKGLDNMSGVVTAVSARAAALKPVFVQQGWSEAVAEQMAYVAFVTALAGSGGPRS